MLENFWGWWMGALFPVGLRTRLGLARRVFLVRYADGRTTGAWEGQNPQAVTRAQQRLIERRNALVLLDVDAGRVVTQRQSVPARAAADLASVLRLALPTLTPFSAAELFWSYRILRDDKANGKIDVAVMLAPVEVFKVERDILADLGVRLDGLQISGSGTTLLPAVAPAALRRRLPVRLLWAGVVCNLLIAAIWLAGVERDLRHKAEAAENAAIALRERLQIASPEARLDQVGTLSQLALDWVTARRSSIDILAALTDALPDEVFATRLQIRDGTLTISGLAPDAAVLVSRLAEVEGFAAPTFASPVQIDNETGQERFGLRLDLEPGS